MVETVTSTLPEAAQDGSDIPARILAFIRRPRKRGVTLSEVARKFQRVRAAEIRAIVDNAEEVRTSKMKSEGGRPPCCSVGSTKKRWSRRAWSWRSPDDRAPLIERGPSSCPVKAARPQP